MIDRINKIEGVGKFESMVQSPEFGKMTLIYGENGSGKSTLCTILRSLKENDPKPIIARKTLCDPTSEKKDIPQFIEIEIDGQTITFSNGSWSKQYDNIEIFDSTFVEQNVYSGSSIEPEQKKNLFQFWIGEGAKLAKEIESIKDDITKLNGCIKNSEEAIYQKVGFNFDELDKLSKTNLPDDINDLIKTEESKIAVINDAQRIKDHDDLKELPTLTFDLEKLKMIIKRNIDNIHVESIQLIDEHINTHQMGEAGRDWIQKGFHFNNSDCSCPFCGQNLSSSQIFTNYKAYFSENFNNLIAEITSAKQDIESALSDSKLAHINSIIQLNNESIKDFWSKYDKSMLEVNIDFADIFDKCRKLLLETINNKIANPVATQTLSDPIETLFSLLVETLAQYNMSIATNNFKIKSLKDSEIRSKSEIEKIHNKYKFISARHNDPEINKMVNDYIDIQNQKNIKEKEKEEKQERAKNISEKDIKLYKDRINHYLEMFCCRFSIGDYTTKNAKTPTIECDFELNNCTFETSSKNADIKPCFSNILSEGDKRSLALCYFFAKLSADAHLNKKIIIFDDPYISLDEHRISYTISIILDILKRKNRVILFSHNSVFLYKILKYSSNERCNIKTLTITPCCANSEILDFNLEDQMRNKYEDSLIFLRNIYGIASPTTHELRNAQKEIREVLETYFRNTHQEDGIENEMMLGNIIEKIQSISGDQNHPLNKYCIYQTELNAIKPYSNPSHHGLSPSSDEDWKSVSPLINISQIKVIIEKVFKIIGKTL